MVLAKYALLPLLTLPLITGCEVFDFDDNDDDSPETFERRELPRELDTSEMQIVEGSGGFGFELMHKILQQDAEASHFISPFSILMAYGMTMNGAEGETYDQMQEVFGLSEMSRDEINEAAHSLIKLLTEFDEDHAQFNIANSIWYRDTFDFKSDFLETNQHYYEAAIEPADFADPETVDLINKWVDDNTEGLIDEIVEGPIDPLTIMYLINTIYFNGEWTLQFDENQTSPAPFHAADGEEIEVDMMGFEETQEIEHATGDGFQAVNLYYGDAGFAITLVLPDEDTSLDSWLKDTEWSDWVDLTENFSEREIFVQLPRFKTEYEIDEFPDLLQELGMIDAFDPDISDFSRMSDARDDLYISDTRHKTFIEVDEAGTEAAAATSVEIEVTSAPPTVRLDRPFFYMIREVESNTPLFMGTYTGITD